MPRLIILALCGLSALASARAADWPQWMGEGRDGVWKETGTLEKFPKGGPKELWRKKIGSGYAGPAVAGGLVYVMDFQTDVDVARKGDPGSNPKIKGKERVLCLSAKDGSEVWKHEYDCLYEVSFPAGPRCTPTVNDGKVYTLGTMGDLYCLDARRGTVIWKQDFKKAPYEAKTPFWGFSGHPLVDGKRLICLVGGKDSALVAFDKDTGKELWRSLPGEEVGYCPPSIITAGGKRQVVVWMPEAINAVDPETGKELWSAELKPSYGMSIMAPPKSGDYLFAGGIGGKSVLLKLDSDKPGAEEVWRTNTFKGATSVFPVNSTPILDKDTIYGVDQPGQLRAVDLKTGKRLWETTRPTTGGEPANSGTAFLVKNGDRFFIFGETGDLTIARLSRKGYEEIDRAHLLEPTGLVFGRNVVWSHPAFAEKCVFARNDREIGCWSLAK